MPTYAIGDLQGCLAPFETLLDRFAFDPVHDRLWFVGDLVNRGPDSLAVLRRLMALGDAVTVVLGNHDLHLLAVAAGARRQGPLDTLDDVLAATDLDEIVAWIRKQPLAFRAAVPDRATGRVVDTVMVHAGALPVWSVDDLMARAAEVERALRSDDWAATLKRAFGNRPDTWSETLAGEDRLRFIINALTRLRFCTPDGRIDFDAKDAPGVASGAFPAPPDGYQAWFDIPSRRSRDARVVVGHWSTLGVLVRDDVVALDSGCVWGGLLTAIRLEDRSLFQVPCPAALPHA
jgi:bis(5'-nucleosyl)-tetraphosphatase (symmetrical)